MPDPTRVSLSLSLCRDGYDRTLGTRLVAGREKEGELATTSLEFKYLHRKSRCKMLIGRGDISNDIITLGMCLQCLFTFVPIGENLTARSMGSHKGIGGRIQIQQT